MKRKILLTLLLLMFLACPAMGQRYRQHQLSIVDEFGGPVTNITSITIFNAGLGTSPTIYNDRAGTLTVTNPITTSSTNSTFDANTGFVKWFQVAPDFKLTITDGTKTLTVDNLDEGDTRFPWFVNYIGTAASLSVNDNQSITVGTDSDMVLAWNNGSDFMSWIPAADGSAFNLGTSGTGANVDFNWYVGTALGIKGNEGAATLVIDGLTTSINASSNFATNINTGTSTGAVTIGSSTSGTLALDTDVGMTINADDSIDMTTSGAAADIDVDAAAGSVIIDGGEAVDDAVTITATGAAGGIDITSLGDIDITTTGAAGEDIIITNTGGSITMTATEAVADAMTIGTSAAGGDLNLDSALGRIEIEAEEDVAEAVLITADGGTLSTVKIHADTGTGTQSIYLLSDVGGITATASAGSMTFAATGATAGDVTWTVGDDWANTVTGNYTLAVTGSTILDDVLFDRVLVTLKGTALTIDAINSGGVFMNTASDGSTTFTLPTAVAGLQFTFVDNSATAADDVTITASSGDTIVSGAAAGSIGNTSDVENQYITLLAIDATQWIVIADSGTWVQS